MNSNNSDNQSKELKRHALLFRPKGHAFMRWCLHFGQVFPKYI